MVKLLFKEGSFRILSDDVGKLSPSEMNELIKMAGTTCYQTRETSKKSPEEFIQMLQQRGHFSMLEHSWRTVELSLLNSPWSKEEVGFHLYKANNLFCITERPFSLLVSGNARMFNEAWLKSGNIFISSILYLLNQENPVLFPSPEGGFSRVSEIDVELNPELGGKKEILVHRAMTVEFNNHSRGFTHEDVRSRNGDEKITSYAQESTRYVDYASGEMDLEKFQLKFILPYNDTFNFDQAIEFPVDIQGAMWKFTPQEFTDLIESWYRALRKRGLRPEEARQWLPIGIRSQIVQTYNLNEWRHWFYIRTSLRAHPEIRFSAVRLLREMQKRLPEVFNDFRISEDGESAVFVGKEKLV